MKEAFVQVAKNGSLKAVSQEDAETIKSFKPNQILRAHLYGCRKARSVLQNKWLHSIFREVAANTDHPEWNSPAKAKRSVKLALKFFKDDVSVIDNRVFFELRSFAFDKMEAQEANKVYTEAKNVCADFLGVEPAVLEAKAKEG